MHAITQQEVKLLGYAVCALGLLNALNLVLGQPFWLITKMIYLGFDDNFSAWFSSALLIVASVTSYDCAKVAKRYLNAGYVYLYLFAALLAFMSADEIARMHETLGGYLSGQAGMEDASYAQNAPWVWIGGPVIIAILGIAFYLLKPFLFYVKGTTTLLGMGFASIIVGGIFLESMTNFLNHDELKWVWEAEIIVEECLEMIGTLLICLALVKWRDGVIEKATQA